MSRVRVLLGRGRRGIHDVVSGRLTRVSAVTIAALACGATPAAAWVERYSFDDLPPATEPSSTTNNAYQDRGLILDQGCGYYRIGGFGPAPFGPKTGGQALVVGGVNPCPTPSIYLGMTNGARTLQLWVRSPALPRQLIATDWTDSGNPVSTTLTLVPDAWTRVQVKRPTGAAIGVVSLQSPTAGEFLVDDVAASDAQPGPPPATQLGPGPADGTTSTSASLTFANADPDPTFTCQLDAEPPAECASPWTRTGLPPGTHTLTVRATGIFGVPELLAHTVQWTIARAPDQTVAPSCPASGPDADRDGLPDACDTVGLPGTVPPTSGESATVKVDAGVVFIKLPASATRAAGRAPARGARLQSGGGTPQSGYVPLKGTATVPVGSTVDARAGTISLTSATGASVKGGGPPTASAQLSAAIFQIRQDRAKRRASTSKKKLPPNPTALILRSPDTAIAAAQCRIDRAGVIRSISAVVPKGTFQFVGAAATVTTQARTANIRTVDRCDGTYVEVGRGVATVTSLHRKRKRVVQVRSGRGYLMTGDFVGIEGRKGR